MARLFMNSKTVKLDVYDTCKYVATEEDFARKKTVVYHGVTGFELIENGTEAWEIESDMSEDEMDPHHEYLVLFFEDGDTSTFRNSYVDMFLR